jgi:hypothetical protein
MNLSILADLRGVIPQVEHAGTLKVEQGVPPSKGYKCNKDKVLPARGHQEHPEHPKIAVTDKNSEVVVTQHPIPQGAPATQQKRKSGKTKRYPQVQSVIEFGEPGPLHYPA